MAPDDKKARLYREKACIDCGLVVRMHIKSKRCSACQADADRRNDREHKQAKARGHTRLIGSMDICQKCGKPYKVEGGRQRYCKDCAPEAVLANVREAAKQRYTITYATPESKAIRQEKRHVEWQVERMCKQCGNKFIPIYPRQVCCCPACQELRAQAITAASDLKRRPKRLEKIKADRSAKKQEAKAKEL